MAPSLADLAMLLPPARRTFVRGPSAKAVLRYAQEIGRPFTAREVVAATGINGAPAYLSALVAVGLLLHDGAPQGRLYRLAQGTPVPVLKAPRPRTLRGEYTRRRSAKRRTCLTCAKPFASEGPHNRICAKCRPGVASLSYSLAG